MRVCCFKVKRRASAVGSVMKESSLRGSGADSGRSRLDPLLAPTDAQTSLCTICRYRDRDDKA